MSTGKVEIDEMYTTNFSVSICPVVRDFHSEFFKYCPVLKVYYVIIFLNIGETQNFVIDIKLPGLSVGDLLLPSRHRMKEVTRIQKLSIRTVSDFLNHYYLLARPIAHSLNNNLSKKSFNNTNSNLRTYLRSIM